MGLKYQRTEEFRQADIIHLHHVDGLVSVRSLMHIKKPIVWTLRDMWPMTGGCHVSMDCQRYKEGCGICPQLGSNFKWDLSKLVLSNKKLSYPKGINVIGNSRWITNCAKESMLFKHHNVQTISNNINTKDFFPITKKDARLALGLDIGKDIVLIGAQTLELIHKGYNKFIEAVNTIPLGTIQIVVFGKLRSDGLAKINHPVINLGYLSDTVALRLAYSAADLFVAPSLFESFGKTLAESMACGTPVVCFDATGQKDIVEHQKTGYLAKPYIAEDLARGIVWVLSQNIEGRKKLSQQSRERAVNLFDSKKIANSYKKLYEEILS